VDCQKVVEFECPNIELLANCITRRLGFTPTKKTLTIEASCDLLKMNGVCHRKETHVPCASAS
jgi:Fur family ferric uptake transcriptional regulator